MKMTTIWQSFRNNRFRYGGYATLTTAIVLGMLIVVNLIVGQLPVQWDLSDNQLFTLSSQTINVLKGLQTPVTIYGLYQPGKEDTLSAAVLKQYRDHSKMVTVQSIDPVKNPGFVKQYATDNTELSEGSLIVTAGKRFKTVAAADLFNYDIEQQQVTSLALEQRLTGALVYVASGKTPIVYTLQGHNEATLPDDVTKQLATENYTLKEISLFTNPVPSDANILMVVAPKSDLTVDETNKIRTYLAQGGRGIFLMDLARTDSPNFQSLFKSYGFTLQRLVVVDTDNTANAGNPILLLPKFAEHDVVNSIKNDKLQILFPGSQAIQPIDLKKRTITIEPLLVSSDKSWGETDLSATSFDKSAKDPDGPFTLAAAITDSVEGKEAKLIVTGTAAFLSPQVTSQVPGNTTLLTNSLSWLSDQKAGQSIPAKSLLSMRLNINGLQGLLCAALVVLIIPLTVLGIGTTVWMRRRHQ